ncbi:MAG: hypothetical protein R2838_15520 [Caldilineaceae bacterium]
MADAEKAKEDEITIVVQVNGKVRDKLIVAPGTPGETLEKSGTGAGQCAKVDRRQTGAQGRGRPQQAGQCGHRLATHGIV